MGSGSSGSGSSSTVYLTPPSIDVGLVGVRSSLGIELLELETLLLEEREHL